MAAALIRFVGDNQTKLRGFSPRANYTDRVVGEVLRKEGVSAMDPHGHILGFLVRT
jgi:hypothetical protein